MKRLWHYKMITFLPNAQLIGLWRTCLDTAKEWAEGNIKNPIIKPVKKYIPEEFIFYCALVKKEISRRGYKFEEYPIVCMKDHFRKILWNEAGENDLVYWDNVIDRAIDKGVLFELVPGDGNTIFKGWHNHEYFDICYWDLYEKHLCGCVPEKEWNRFMEGGREYV